LEPLAKGGGAAPLPCASLTAAGPSSLSWVLPPAPESAIMTVISRPWSPNDYSAEYATPPNDARTLSIQWLGGEWTNH
jgi:hypothetical protein